MKILHLTQGGPEWLAHRRTTRNASDAPAMMGASPYVTRAELVRQRATGIEREVDAATQARFDRGHAVEPLLRAMAEKLLGEDLFPVTATSDDGYLGASFDGVTLAEDVILEAKQYNASKVDCILRGEIPPVDLWQVSQQFAVCETAQRCLYLVGDGTEDGTYHLYIPRSEVEGLIPQLRASWAQFDADVAAYVPAEPKPVAVAAPVEGFGALSLRIEGRVLASNLDAFKAGADAFIARLPRPDDLQTDQDFADAESAVKACEEAETRIKAAKDAAQAQMADVDAAFRLADTVAQEIRAARLALSKIVAAEKENRRDQIVQAGVDAVQAHYRTLNSTLGEYALQVPASMRSDIGAAIKGKRTIAGLRDAIDSAIASAKIEASQTAERVRQNIAVLSEDAAGHESLFSDRHQLVSGKAPDDLRNLVAARVADHQKREAERLEVERERIRQEEAARIERERVQQTPATGAPAAQQPLDDAANNAGVATGSRNVSPSESVTRGSLSPAISSAAPISLGQIKDWIAPLSIDAAGLASLGFKPSATKGAAKLYPADDFPHICGALARLIAEAPARAAHREAA